MSDKELKVPNIGEFKDVEIIEVLVSEGQSILENDPLITIESDKSSIEIPSAFDGKVKSVNIKIGDKVSEGDTILILENSNTVKKDNEENYKISQEEKKFQIKKKSITNNVSKKKIMEKSVREISTASPKARKFARELGIDINEINGSERRGRVVERDIKKFISSKINKTIEAKETSTENIISEFSHSDFGEVEIRDIPRVKKLASTYLVNSWTKIPHVTNHDEADITEMEDFRISLTDIYTGEKKKLRPGLFVL